MPQPTPFHERTAALCRSLLYKEWAGCYAVCRYDTVLDREYFALRHAAGLMDATPLYKYELEGPDAAEVLGRMTVRDVPQLSVGRVSYVCWCDERGKVLDDGTITRLGRTRFRLTSAEPSLAWLWRCARGCDVRLTDVSRSLGALALQGPRARDVLRGLIGAPADELPFFCAVPASVDGLDVLVSRTGYTGDLGYELWIDAEHGPRLWDVVLEAGGPHGLQPTGLDALDVVRVEAGFILQGVDYFSARDALIDSQASSPFELGLGWMVRLDRDPFVGQAALRAEAEAGSPRALVGLDIDWGEYEALHAAVGLPPALALGTCREGVPVHRNGRQVGQATSRTWSPTLKRYLALATVDSEHAEPGTELEVEVTVEYRRRRATARVTPRPFFDPPRKKGEGQA